MKYKLQEVLQYNFCSILYSFQILSWAGTGWSQINTAQRF